MKENRQSLYYRFEDAARRLGDQECIWSRERSYTWDEAYARTNQFGQWFLRRGVGPHDLVAFYMQNSPDFIFAWLGLWSVGAAPAMINFHLSGKALMHCLKISEAKLLLVDDDFELVGRIGSISEAMGQMKLPSVVMDSTMKATLSSMDSTRPKDDYRSVVQGDWPVGLFYTR